MTLADKIVVLQSGRIEQVGSPRELYKRPDNLFVAQFIGSPKMNFIEGEEAAKHGAQTIGIRPEDLFLSDGGPLAARESHVEKLGGDTNVIAKVHEHSVTARLFGQHAISEGEELHLSFSPDKAYRFDSDGMRLR